MSLKTQTSGVAIDGATCIRADDGSAVIRQHGVASCLDLTVPGLVTLGVATALLLLAGQLLAGTSTPKSLTGLGLLESG